MIHAQQKGYSPAEILRGLCDAVARNFKSGIVKGRPVEAPVALIGAVSQNAGVTAALREAFALAETDLFVPEHYAWCGAIGAAILEAEEPTQAQPARDPPPLPARSRRASSRYRAAFHEQRRAAARPRRRLRAAARRRADSGLPGHRHRLGLHQRRGHRRVRRGDARHLPAHRRPADRGGAAGPGRSRAASGAAAWRSAAWAPPDRAAS